MTRTAQIESLRLVGADDTDIAILLGDNSEPVKPSNESINRNLVRLGMDILPMPYEAAGRLKHLAKIARIEYHRLKYESAQ
jgi:hypothetical protein